MCGIAGIIGPHKSSQGIDQLSKMLDQMTHRGPDSHGKWAIDGLALGMQRLSIIDLEGGDQPIWTATGVGIVFNGEIYNYKKIMAELKSEGVTFNTHSDTEVIVQLYLKKGIDAIHQLEGMFGICIYDPNIQKIYLIRDRLGIKPLYYYKDDQNFIFSSEIKAIMSILEASPDVDKQSLWHYLTLRYVPAPKTIWQSITKLEPGTYLEYDLSESKYTLHKYWDFSFKSAKKDRGRHYEKEFENLFLEAVEKRLLASDVPVGILLSGGLDSSCVAAAAVELGHKNFHTFSVGFSDGGDFSELKYAKMVSSHIGSEHHEIIIGKEEFVEAIDKLVWHTDEPLADLASIPLYFVSQLASKHVKVALTGEGADEIFAGYNLDNLARKLFYLKMIDILPKPLLSLVPLQSIKQLSHSGYRSFLKDNAAHMTSIFSEEEKYQLCQFDEAISTHQYLKDLYAHNQSDEPIDHLQDVYCRSWLVEDLLMKADKMSMATSLELRVPFLDHKLVEWAAELPLEHKVGSFLKGFSTKKIVREFAKKRLPHNIIHRPKQGFPVPAYRWLAEGKINNLVTKSLDILVEKGGINKEVISSALSGPSLMKSENQHKAWNMIIYAQWLNKWAQ